LSAGSNRSKALLAQVTERFLSKNGSEIVDITQKNKKNYGLFGSGGNVEFSQFTIGFKKIFCITPQNECFIFTSNRSQFFGGISITFL
jgi:hypothetical protein